MNTPDLSDLLPEKTIEGKKAKVSLYRTESKETFLHIQEGSKITCTPTNLLNFRKMGATNLEDALETIANDPSELKVYHLRPYRGPQGLVQIFQDPETKEGFGKLIKRGQTPIKFNLAAIDYERSKAKTLEEIIRTAIYKTGEILLLPKKREKDSSTQKS